MKTLILFTVVLILAGCQKVKVHDTSENLTPVKFKVSASASVVQSRNTVESDIQIMLFGIDNVVNYCISSVTGDISISVVPGRYNLYVITGVETRLSGMKEHELKDFELTDELLEFQIPTTHHSVINIPDQSAVYIIPEILTSRTAARLNWNVQVSSEGIELESVSLCSVPNSFNPFAVQSNPVFSDGKPTRLSGQSANGIFYLFENLAGINTNILNHRDKSPENAPDNASYLHIRATADNRMIDYFVFLGGNNTTDFNIHRNTTYTYLIDIKGPDEIDTRIYDYAIHIVESGTLLPGYIAAGDSINGRIDIEGRNAIYNHSYELEFYGNIPSGITLNGAAVTTDPVPISNEYIIGFNPHSVVVDNTMLSYTIYVTDNYGYKWSFEQDYLCMNLLEIEYSGLAEKENVIVSIDKGYVKKQSGSKDLILCPGNILLNFETDGYSILKGLYTEPLRLTSITSDNTYNYLATKPAEKYYADFHTGFVDINTDPDRVAVESEVEVIRHEHGYTLPRHSVVRLTPITKGQNFEKWITDEKYNPVNGNTIQLTIEDNIEIQAVFQEPLNLSIATTSNSYVTSKRNHSYRFNGLIKGNGVTNGIDVNPANDFKYAEVLWETGNTRGEVISEVFSDGKDITFTTGDLIGNAVIAAFNGNDEIVWSWHIWSIDGELTSVHLTDGHQIMDRNLGALSLKAPESYGLYYQWGRKDPFMGPNNAATTVNLDNHYWTQTIGTVVLSKSFEMPMRILNGNGSGSTHDWLEPQDYRLWGLREGATVSSEVIKTLFDPCPVGWKIMHVQSYWESFFLAANRSYTANSVKFSHGGQTLEIPFGGLYDTYEQTWNNVGEHAYFWFGSTNYNYTISMGFMDYLGCSNQISSNIWRANTAPVRCIKDK
ncbi:MAG: DUF4906 domain-containing protein [Alistipes sp.]|nr:DUF4906 domain-containing protein [Alistipes sp.]